MKKSILGLLLSLSLVWSADRPDTMTTHTWMASTWGTVTAAGVQPSPVPPPSGNAWKNVWIAWGGAAWDTTYHRMDVFGGGHTDYSGNEIYGFKPDSGWKRVANSTDTSKIVHSNALQPTGYYSISGTDSTHPDYHAPRSRHTYDLVQATGGKFYVMLCPGPYNDANGPALADMYTFGLSQWDSLGSTVDTTLSPAASTDGPSAMTGVDSLGRIWTFTGGSNAVLSYYSPGRHVITTIGSYWNGAALSNYTQCASVPKKGRTYCFGDGMQGYFKMDTSMIADSAYFHNITTTNGAALIAATAPGITYDSKDSIILGWRGTDTVYSLNLTSLAWTKIPKANTKAPTAPQGLGTFGRFQYMPEWNAVALSNSADDSVYYWKPSAGGGPTPPTSNYWGSFGNSDDFLLKFGL